jgi:hypothetical protein
VITPLEFFGSAIELTLAVDTSPLNLRWRFWRIRATATGLTFRWPNRLLPGLPMGGPVFIVANFGPAGDTTTYKTFNVRDDENLDVATPVINGKAVLVSTYIDSNGRVRWATNFTTLTYSSY